MKVVIVGGVAGGATAAARLRRLDENAEIVVFEKSGYISYANCGLPYFIGGAIEDPKALTLQMPESFDKRFNVAMKVHHEVTKINPDKKTVEVKNLTTGETFEESYDKLLLSPGARPLIPNIPGINSDRVMHLRTVEDSFRIKDYVLEHGIKNAVIVGAGFIGIELCENLTKLGINTTLVQKAKQVMKGFDSDMAAIIHGELRKNGVNLKLGITLTSIDESENGLEVVLDDVERIPTDIVVMAIGVLPESELAKEIGCELGLKGSIVVNEKMETSVKDIYAVGDAVQVKNYVTNEDTLIPLAGPANKQGRIAANNICGGNSVFKGSQRSSIIKVFELTAAETGISEKDAQSAGLKYEKIIISPMSHASYYPGGKLMNIKFLFEKDTYRILGAQIIGFGGVDKRIDVLATAIRAGLTAIDLKELELAYAPPYSSAKDPVNILGLIADNMESGIVKQWYMEETERIQNDDNAIILDTRTVYEFERGHIENSVNIPVDEIRNRINEIPKDKKIYAICQSGLRSYIASRILMGYGFDVYNFAGGYRYYSTVENENALIEASTPCGMDK